MAARRAAQKNAVSTDTSSKDADTVRAAKARTAALRSDATKSQKLSSKLSREARQQQIRQATGDLPQSGDGSNSNGSHLPASESGKSGSATTPIAKGSYNIVATFGQVGLWSRYHTGVDFSAPIGTPIQATSGGVITNAGAGPASGWAGTYVTLKFPDGQQMLFAHMSSVSVSVGQQVSAGQNIGRVGQTGRAFGPHTHLELYPAGVTPGDVYRAINPLPWFSSHGVNV